MTAGSQRVLGIEPVEAWLRARQTVRISGLDLEPIEHPAMPDTPWAVSKGQATVYFLRQQPQGRTWLLKKFRPSRRPTDTYLKAVTSCLPGSRRFFTCTQRRILRPDHLDRRHSGRCLADLANWLPGTILMPKVPGSSWGTLSDGLREQEVAWSRPQRLEAAVQLADCIAELEAGRCSHRDLSLGNVFYDAQKQRLYLIDWDCLYHPSLPFQPNTTFGTLGYVAPFLADGAGQYSVRDSWTERADRFALSILIAEFLLTGPGSPVHEDGSLFSQAQLSVGWGSHLAQCLNGLGEITPACARLLQVALDAREFGDCPAPGQWKTALSRARQTQQGARTDRSQQRTTCGRCQKRISIPTVKYQELVHRGMAPLCGQCLRAQMQEAARRRHQRDEQQPWVTCEHCGKAMRVAKIKLEALRSKGRPVLCAECLAQQMQVWEEERQQWEQSHPAVACSQCAKTFRIHRGKLDVLRNTGKAPLCSTCLKAVLRGNRS